MGDTADRAALREALRAHRAEAVMHFAASAVTRLVFSSSCATYGHQLTPLLAEDHPQLPVKPYGETKLALERAIRWYGAAHGLRAVTLRDFNAASADADGEIGETHDPEPYTSRIASRDIPGRISPRRRGDPPRLVADGAAARRLLGWTPRASTLDAMRGSAWRWHQRGHHP